MSEIPAEAVQADCNDDPHAYTSMHGPHCPIRVDQCYVCGAVNWADLTEQAAQIAAQALRDTAEVAEATGAGPHGARNPLARRTWLMAARWLRARADNQIGDDHGQG